MRDRNIESLINNNLCYCCGTCDSICPTNAIEMKLKKNKGLIYPIVDNDKCINCGKCQKVCPINNIDIKENHFPTDTDYYGVFKTNNMSNRNYAASGGVVTEIVKYLLDEGLINKAIVAGMDNKNKCDARSFIITKSSEIDNFSGSIYQPVSLNNILKEIQRDDRIAIVGLPCHIRGAVNFFNMNKNLKDCLVFKIGLICTIGRGKHGTDVVLERDLKVKEKDRIKKLHYRVGTSHPLNMEVQMNDGSIKNINYHEYLQKMDFLFIPKGCLFCTDLFNDYAHITIGDPWGIVSDKASMVIIRDDRMKEIVLEMKLKQRIDLIKEITKAEAINTQKHCVNYKIKNYSKRISIYKRIGVSIPNISGFYDEKSNFIESIFYLILLFHSYIFNSKYGYIIMKYSPKRVMKYYRAFIANQNCK